MEVSTLEIPVLSFSSSYGLGSLDIPYHSALTTPRRDESQEVDDSRLDYDAVMMDTLPEEDRDIVLGEPEQLSDVGLRILWSNLVTVKARGELLQGWIMNLPANYARILPRSTLRWLWKNERLDHLPPSLARDSLMPWPVRRRFHLLSAHLARKRADELGIESMAEYCALFEEKTYEKHKYSKDGFFTTSPSYRDERPLFSYNKEMRAISHVILLDMMDRWSQTNNTRHPRELRYVLQQWCNGSYTSYQPSNKVLLRYAVGLLQVMYKMVTGMSLEDLSCYTTPNLGEIPTELSDQITLLLLKDCPSLGDNVTFIRLFYDVAEIYILRSLHRSLLRKMRDEKREACSIQ